MLHSAAGLQARWTERDSFVAFPFLFPDVAIAIRPRLFPGAALGCVTPAMNFDPPEDHPNEPEFEYVDILINDFSDLNDDVGTLHGVRAGSHLRQQLEWQPKTNPEVTRSIAIVAPGPCHRTEVKEKGAIGKLSLALTERGYDAIAIRCKAGDDAEFMLATT